MEKGYVYIMTNPSFKEDWVKIGKSKRLPNVRSRELFNTAVPLPYEIYATLRTSKFSEAERLIHKNFDRISDLRINKNREFFNIEPEKAYELLCDIKEVLDDGEVELYGDNIQVDVPGGNPGKKQGSRFDFFKCGLKVGDEVHFIDDHEITAIVASNREVLFEEKLWYLSGLVKELYTRSGKVSPSGSYQGPKYFLFNGVKLTDLKIEDSID